MEAGYSGGAGDSAFDRPETPGSSRTACVLGGNPCLGTSNSWEIDQIGVWGRKAKLDHVQRQVSIGSKPQKTHQNERSIRGTKFGAIFGDFRFYGGNHKSVTNPWQPKAADTI